MDSKGHPQQIRRSIIYHLKLRVIISTIYVIKVGKPSLDNMMNPPIPRLQTRMFTLTHGIQR